MTTILTMGPVDYFKLQYFRYTLLTGLYMMDWFESCCVHVIIFIVVYLLVKYVGSFGSLVMALVGSST